MKLKQTTINSNQNLEEKIIFTFLINPTLLSQIKLISYISNQKLYETINDSISLFIDNYNKSNNTNITDIINLQNKPNNTQIEIEEKEDITNPTPNPKTK